MGCHKMDESERYTNTCIKQIGLERLTLSAANAEVEDDQTGSW